MKKFSSMISLIIVVCMLSACSGNSGTGNNTEPSNKPEANTQTPTTEPAKPAEPDVITIFMAGGATFPDGQDINDNPWVKLIEEENNVDLQIEYGPAASDEYMSKLTMKFASNNIPDLFFISSSYQNWLTENAQLGALKALDEYIPNYPILQDAVYPSAWEAAKYDNKIYAIPVLNDGNKGTDNVYIRKDWLDKLKLDIPVTLEDYKNVAIAFRDQDPDGNNKNDTYGMIAYENMLGWSHLFGAFGVIPGYWIEKEGQLVSSDVQPEMKEALSYIAELYKEKLLDNEWPVLKVGSYTEKVANNKAGIYEGSWAATRSEINTSKQNDPSAEWIPIAPPVGPEGKQGVFGGPDYKSLVLVSSTATNVDAIMRMLEWMAQPENTEKIVFGFDDLGEDFMYSIVDGKYAMNFENHNKYGYRQQLMFMQPKELNEKKMESLGADFDLIGTIRNAVKYGIPNQFNGAPTETMVESLSTLEQMRNEVFTKIIVGTSPISAFDDFVKEYNAKGGEKIAAEVQSWYETVKSK